MPRDKSAVGADQSTDAVSHHEIALWIDYYRTALGWKYVWKNQPEKTRRAFERAR